MKNSSKTARQTGIAVIALALTLGFLQAAEPTAPVPAKPSEAKEAKTAGAGAGQEYTGVTAPTAAESTAIQSAPPQTATISVNPEQVVGPLQKKLFGLNCDRSGFEAGLVDPATGKIDPDGAALFKGIPMPLNRVAGSDAMRFRWKQAIGPESERTPMKLWPWGKEAKIVVGPIEFEQWLRSIDPKAGTAWVLNIFQETAKDHADLVEFLTGEPGKPRGEIDWAKRRVELGLKDPVNVEIWEIGNEVDWDSKEKWTSVEYVEECRKTIKAIRAVNPKAKIAVHALTAPWSPTHKEFPGASWAGWHRNLLKALGTEIDYISFHPYYNGHPTSLLETYLDRIRDDIKQITGDNRIRVYISEHARWPSMPKTGPWNVNWYQTHCLDGCLATGQFLVRCITRPEITAASYHAAISAGPWGVLYRDKTSGKLYPTGIAELFRLFAKLPEGEVVTTTVTGPDTDVTHPDLNYVATAVRTAKGLYLVVVNRGPARQTTFTLGGNYRLKAGWTLTGPDGKAFNTYDNRPLAIQPIAVAKGGEALNERLIPALSMTVFELEKGQ